MDTSQQSKGLTGLYKYDFIKIVITAILREREIRRWTEDMEDGGSRGHSHMRHVADMAEARKNMSGASENM